MPNPSITWVLERDVFASGDAIRPAASAAGHRVINWSDEWWSDSVRPRLTGAVLFHGSLGNADRIPRELPWKPGAYCQTTNFHCSAWYPAATEWLLHDRSEIHPASRFIADPDTILDRLGGSCGFTERRDHPIDQGRKQVLQHLDDVPWADLEHAYGSAADVPDLLRNLLDPDPKVRSEVLSTLYSNVFHQGTRYPATPYVIPFLIEICANPAVPDRGDLLRFWGSLIAGYFSVQERPCWGDGERIYWCGEIQQAEADEPYSAALPRSLTCPLTSSERRCRRFAIGSTRLVPSTRCRWSARSFPPPSPGGTSRSPN